MTTDVGLIADAAKEVASLIKKVVPSAELKKLEKFQQFLLAYRDECVTDPADHDRILTYRENRNIFFKTMFNALIEANDANPPTA